MDKETIHRCTWAENAEAIYQNYHDNEWGVPVYEDQKLFEMLILEGFHDHHKGCFLHVDDSNN